MSFVPDNELPGLVTAELAAYVSGCAFSPDGERLAFALGDGSLLLLATDTGESSRVVVHQGAALSLAAVPQGFLTGGDDGRVALTSPAGEARSLARFSGRWVEHVAADAKGNILVAAVGKQVALLCEDGNEPGFFEELPSTVGGLAVSPDGRGLAASHYNGVTMFVPPRPTTKGYPLEGPGSNLTLFFSRDGTKLACATQEKSVRVYDLNMATGYLLEGYPEKVKSLAFTADGNFILTGGEQAFVAWPVDAATDPETRQAEVFGAFEHGSLNAVAAHPTLPLMAGGFTGGVIFIGSLERKGAAPMLVLGGRQVTCLTWSPDGRLLAGGTDEGQAFVLDLAGGAGAA